MIRYAMSAQERLYRRYWRMQRRGKPSQITAVAAAREPAGVVWGLMTDRIAG